MKVSIITVCYNSDKTIKDTIESVLSQTYKNIEYIVIDGKSTDATVSILESYNSVFSKKNIGFKWISEQDSGLYDAMNKGIKCATGDIVGILNSDDFYYDNNVVKDIVDKFLVGDIDCTFGKLLYVKEDDINYITRVYAPKEYKSGLFEKSWTPAHPTFYCKRNIYLKLGLYRTDFIITSDQELMYRYLEKYKIKSLYMDRFIIKMREGGISHRGLKNLIIVIREIKESIVSNGGNFNLFKYMFFKLLKIKQLRLRKNKI